MFSDIEARTRVLSTGTVNRSITLARGQSKYPIKDIDGLGPVPADIARINDVSDRGSDYLSSLTGERNIVMRLGFEPDYAANETITDLRLALNRVFMPGNQVELDFDHEVYGVVSTKGRVESNQPVIFSKDPEVQISIICGDPYFTDLSAMHTVMIPEGTGTQFVVNSDLDVPVGFILDMDISGTPGQIQVSKATPRIGDDYFLLNKNMLVGDKVTFNTIKNQRGVTLVRSGSTTSELGLFGGSLVDSRIYPGPNNYRFNEIAGTNNLRFRWYKTYGSL